jgi:hypothetical protein
MQDSARYKKLDFVDYFKAMTQTREEGISKFINHPKCLAALDAFCNNKVILGRTAQFVEEQLRIHPSACLGLLKQAARRHDLPTTDVRYIGISDQTHAEEERLSAAGFWSLEWRRSGWNLFHSGDETEKLWKVILRADQAQYVEYWKAANREEYEHLFLDRELLARIDAFNRRQDEFEPWDHVYSLEKFAGHHLASLETRMRGLVLAHFSRDIERGIVAIPTNLRTQFPHIYAERGIT